MKLPLIGLTAALRSDPAGGSPQVALRRTYIQAVIDAGGLPVLIPPSGREVLRATFARLDGLLLPGGGDIMPTRYDETPHMKLGSTEPERDELEITLGRWALDEGKPVLGICRGIQVMNIAAGGSLYQDIPSQYRTRLRHATDLSLARQTIAHDITIDPQSRLAGMVGTEPLPVNSWHHQAIKDLGSGFVVTARAADGIVEAFELPQHAFAVGVQFHPEDLYLADERVARLFSAFVDACRE